MVPVLETERLILQPLVLADAVAVQRLFPVWGVVRLLAPNFSWPYPEDGALTYYRNVALPAVERGDEWHWTLRLKSQPEEVVGAVVLFRSEGNNRGFWIGEAWRGRGLMTEAAGRVTAYWFEELGMPVMRVKKAAENVASRGISVREGMRLVGVGLDDFIGGRFVSEVWEITAQEWFARHRR